MAVAASRLAPVDVMRSGSLGLRTRRTRAALSALGIAIGIASMVGVLGLSESSKADLISALDRLGTNLLRVEPGNEIFGGAESKLPRPAQAMIGRIPPVHAATATGKVADVSVRRTDYIEEFETNGISVVATDVNLLRTLQGKLADGVFLNGASSRYPVTVLGAVTAQRLGISDLAGRTRVWMSGRWFTVVGVLESLPLAPEIDRSALIGWKVAARYLDTARNPSAIYVRSDPEHIEAVRSVLARTANPEHPEEVNVSRPSDALAARAAAKSAFTGLFLGLGAVALLVGGVGIANVMVISVLERRSEIGLRRALGATKRHILLQFLTESLVLAGMGGAVGVSLGAVVTIVYAAGRGWHAVVPGYALGAGFASAVVIGAVAGIYPAIRAARLAPTEALRSI